MRTVTVSVEVPNPPEQVYEFLEVLGNHERFMDHFMVDWKLSGPPRRLLEETVGGPGGKRHTRGTYTLEGLSDRGTGITFALEFVELPASERLMGPLQRAYVRRVNRRGMKRLAEQLAAI